MATRSPRRRAPAMPDIAVLGAGPAGLAAAVAAHQAGARVTIVDAGPHVGGQYWRHQDGDDGRGHHLWSVLCRLREIPLDFRPNHAIWHVAPTDDGFVTHTS